MNCHNSRKGNRDETFFRFPTKEPLRCSKWVQNVRRQDLQGQPLDKLKNLILCSSHFEDIMFRDPGKTRLMWNAYPTLFQVRIG